MESSLCLLPKWEIAGARKQLSQQQCLFELVPSYCCGRVWVLEKESVYPKAMRHIVSAVQLCITLAKHFSICLALVVACGFSQPKQSCSARIIEDRVGKNLKRRPNSIFSHLISRQDDQVLKKGTWIACSCKPPITRFLILWRQPVLWYLLCFGRLVAWNQIQRNYRILHFRE